MRNEEELWSDDFDLDEGPDSVLLFDDDAELDPSDIGGPTRRKRAGGAAWQRVEDRFEELRLRAETSDWNYWDEDDDYPLQH